MRPAQAIQMAQSVVTSTLGAISGKGALAQQSASQSFNNTTSSPNNFNMTGNFTAGNSAIAEISTYRSGSTRLTGVTIGGNAASLIYRESTGGAACVEWWQADNLTGGSSQVSIAHAAGGNPWFINACCIEYTPLGALDTSRDQNGSSTTPTFVTTASQSILDAVTSSIWRDNSGGSTSNSVTSPYVAGFSQADGNANLGGASGHKITTTLATQGGAFSCSPTCVWFGSTVIVKFATPGSIVDCGECVMTWGSSVWSPTTISRAVSSGTNKLLVSIGGWWDTQDTSGASALPTDNNGTFTAIYNPVKVNTNRPMVQQVCYQASPTTATHVITPPDINAGTSADGYFSVLEIPGIDTSGNPVRCTGSTHVEHAAVTPPDPNTIQTITVTTTGTDAQVGDIAILTVTIDMNNTPTNVAFVPPAGWQMMRNHFNCALNVGHIVCIGKVSTAGYIAATVTWTDPDTFIVDGQITVFKHQ